MIVVYCPECRLALRVIGELDEVNPLVGEGSSFWPDQYVCPRCEYKHALGSMEQALNPGFLSAFDLRDLSVNELFAALEGLGLPDEGRCHLDIIATLLKTQPVRRVVGEDVRGTDRCVVHHLELGDGTRLYFGAGPEGAVVYRNVPPQSYVARLEKRDE